MAKGAEAKANVVKKIQAAFGADFIGEYDKKVYVWSQENGEKIQISGFGTFELKCKEAREGINPKTGEKICVEATRTPVFKFGKAYKDSFNK